MRAARPLRCALLAALVWVVVLPVPAHACAPVVPLVRLFGIPFFALPITIVVKSAAFAHFERRIPWYIALSAMVLANLVSSMVGLALAMPVVAPAVALGALFFVFVASLPPARRIVSVAKSKRVRNSRPDILAVGIVVLYVITLFLFGLASGVLDAVVDGEVSGGAYWVAKLAYLYPALALAIGLTTFWEEWVIARLLRQRFVEQVVLPSVLRANLVAFVLVLALGAGAALPHRLESPEFFYFGWLWRALLA